MSSKVFENIHEGDSTDRLIQVLGQPDSFGPSQRIPGGTAWYYKTSSELCGFSIVDDVVKYIGCQKYQTPGYAKAVGTFLQGFGQGLQNANKNQTNCTTTGSGGFYQTTCN
jgi:hypothetical protein